METTGICGRNDQHAGEAPKKSETPTVRENLQATATYFLRSIFVSQITRLLVVLGVSPLFVFCAVDFLVCSARLVLGRREPWHGDSHSTPKLIQTHLIRRSCCLVCFRHHCVGTSEMLNRWDVGMTDLIHVDYYVAIIFLRKRETRISFPSTKKQKQNALSTPLYPAKF